MIVIEAKNARVFINDVEVTSVSTLQEIEDALAPPGTARDLGRVTPAHLWYYSKTVQICDHCGCLHRFWLGHTCESCHYAIARVLAQQTAQRVCRAITGSTAFPTGKVILDFLGKRAQPGAPLPVPSEPRAKKSKGPAPAGRWWDRRRKV